MMVLLVLSMTEGRGPRPDGTDVIGIGEEIGTAAADEIVGWGSIDDGLNI